MLCACCCCCLLLLLLLLLLLQCPQVPEAILLKPNMCLPGETGPGFLCTCTCTCTQTFVLALCSDGVAVGGAVEGAGQLQLLLIRPGRCWLCINW